YCSLAALTEPILGDYDLITCLGALEHAAEIDARICIRNLTEHTKTILFSPNISVLRQSADEPSNSLLDWLDILADCNFAQDIERDASFVSPQAFFAQASDIRPSDESLVAFALAKDRENELVRERERSRTANARIAELEERLRVNEETLDAVLNSRGWRLLNRLREFRDRFPGLSRVWRVKHNYLYQTWIQLR